MLDLLDSDKRMIFAPLFIFEIDVSCKHYKHRTVHLVSCVILTWFVLNRINLSIILNFDKNRFIKFT